MKAASSNPEHSMTCGPGRLQSSFANFYALNAQLRLYEADHSDLTDFRALRWGASAANCGRFQEIHRVLRSGGDRQDDFAECRLRSRGPTRHGWDDHLVASLAGGRNYALPGVHRHDRRGNPENEAAAEHGSNGCAASATWGGDDGGAWVQQHLRSRYAARSCRQAWPPQDKQPAGSSRSEHWSDPRVSRPPGWLDAVERAVRFADAERTRDRSRAWLRGSGEWVDRPKRRLFDGRKNRRKRSRCA